MTQARFSLIPAQAVCDNRLNSRALQVLALLGTYTDKNGWCFPSQSRLADQLGCSRPTINRALNLLVSIGYVQQQHQYSNDGSQTASKYRVLLDTEHGKSPELELDPCNKNEHPLFTQSEHPPSTLGEHLGVHSERTHNVPNELPIKDISNDISKKPDHVQVKYRLALVVGEELAQAVYDHRKKIKKPLTPHAAKLLAGKFSQCAEPQVAAEAMISNGWQGFEPEWLNRQSARANSPPKPTFSEACDDVIHQLREYDNDGKAAKHHRDDQRADGPLLIEHG